MKYNKNFDLLNRDYLFREISKRVSEFKQKNKGTSLVNLGIGDVTLPLSSVVIEAGKKALSEMENIETFKGYGDYEGYEFLRQSVVDKYKKRGVNLNLNEVFISDGAKNAMGGILSLFRKCTALIPNPVYPAYLDTNIISSNAVFFAEGNINNNFLPLPNGKECDLIYICSPSNPTGAVYNNDQLKKWIEYAKRMDAVILFDSAYEAFIREDYPHSIFEIEGARDCAIEFNSLSKSAGFTGVRCGYVIIPECSKLNKLYRRYLSSFFNGTSYIVQRMAQSALSDEGQRQTKNQLLFYENSAKKIRRALDKKGIYYIGGVNSPYIWLKCNGDSWEFFDYMLNEKHIIGTPGSGFGSSGEGFFRLSSFGLKENDNFDI